MILLALTAAAAVQEPPLDPLTEEEIVIVGQRLDALSVTVGRDATGRWSCSLSTSTGYPRLDDRLCRATTKCVGKGNREPAAINACIAKAKPGLLAELRKRIKRGGK